MDGYIFPIALYRKNAALVGEWGEPQYYLKVPQGLGPSIRGAVAFWEDERLWYGADEEVERALETIRHFIAQLPITEVIVNLEVRVSLDGLSVEYRVQNLEGEWGQWLLAGPLLAGPQGEKGERFRVFADREPPNSFTTIYRQLQVADELGEYVDFGEPEEITIVYDGWVNVGVYVPTVIDNADGTMSVYKQWYCREENNPGNFEPDGPVELVADIVLPQGPQGNPGGYWLPITENPQANVSIFYRRYFEYDPAANEGTGGYVATEIIQEMGGVIAPPGETGRVGDYFDLEADNPPGEPNTVALYKQRRDGLSDLAEGARVQIGSAVALQGPQGEQGPIGPPGGIDGWAPSEAWIEATEWQRTSWVAYRLTKWVAETVDRAVRYDGILAGAGFVGAAGMATVAGFAVGGPPGAALGFVAGLGIGLIAPLADAALALSIEDYQSEAGITAIAQELYCSLLDHRDWSTASLEAWTAANEGGNPRLLLLGSDPNQATKAIIAQHWREIGMSGAQLEITSMLLNYVYDPAIDYTSLPCTPVIGTDQVIYDFTVSDGGFVLQGDMKGVWVDGEGWRETNYDGNWDYITIKREWPQAYTMTYWELLYDLTDAGPGNFVPYMGYNGGYSHVRNPSPTGTNLVWSENVPNGGLLTNGFILNIPVGIAGIGRLKRMSITFDGDIPA